MTPSWQSHDNPHGIWQRAHRRRADIFKCPAADRCLKVTFDVC
jgi:hypothetical protein